MSRSSFSSVAISRNRSIVFSDRRKAALDLSVISQRSDMPAGLVGRLPLFAIQPCFSRAWIRLQTLLWGVCLKPLVVLTMSQTSYGISACFSKMRRITWFRFASLPLNTLSFVPRSLTPTMRLLSPLMFYELVVSAMLLPYLVFFCRVCLGQNWPSTRSAMEKKQKNLQCYTIARFMSKTPVV